MTFWIILSVLAGKVGTNPSKHHISDIMIFLDTSYINGLILHHLIQISIRLKALKDYMGFIESFIFLSKLYFF